MDEICPDCKRPVSTHEMFNPARCPVVRFPMPPRAVWDWYDGTGDYRRFMGVTYRKRESLLRRVLGLWRRG